MRIYEIVLPPTYLCSECALKIGSITEVPHACDLGAGLEAALERCRPENALPRDKSLRLSSTSEHQAEYIYLVEPIGQLDRFHNSWLKRLGQTSIYSEGEIDQYARGFWSGEVIPEDRYALWEYRALKAKIIKRVGGLALRVAEGWD